MGKSAFGPGIKPGGPNYVAQLMRFRSTANPTGDGEIRNAALSQLADDLRQQAESAGGGRVVLSEEEVESIIRAIQSYDFNALQEFNRQHDDFRVIGQDNIRRYLPVASVHVRVQPEDSWFEIFARPAAAHAARCRVVMKLQGGRGRPDGRAVVGVAML